MRNLLLFGFALAIFASCEKDEEVYDDCLNGPCITIEKKEGDTKYGQCNMGPCITNPKGN